MSLNLQGPFSLDVLKKIFKQISGGDNSCSQKKKHVLMRSRFNFLHVDKELSR